MYHCHPFYQVNGQLTLGENIADNGGLALSYQSFTARSRDTSLTPQQLPGLNITDQQLFFLAYGQVHISPHHVLYQLRQELCFLYKVNFDCSLHRPLSCGS